jgi:hypothetical protein
MNCMSVHTVNLDYREIRGKKGIWNRPTTEKELVPRNRGFCFLWGTD